MIAPISSILNSPSTSATTSQKEDESMDKNEVEKKEMPANTEQQVRCNTQLGIIVDRRTKW